jgi:hypothetical protein
MCFEVQINTSINLLECKKITKSLINIDEPDSNDFEIIVKEKKQLQVSVNSL